MINKVYNMDCMDYISNCKDKEFDLAIVDPPYGLNQDNRKAIGNKSMKGKDTRFPTKEWDYKIPDRMYFNGLFRISKNQIIWGGNYFIEYLKPVKAWVFWDKEPILNIFSDGELAWTSFNKVLKRIRIKWNGKIRTGIEKGYIAIHPTQKPIKLYKWLLQNYAKPGQTIFDSHVGSGSIRIACYDMGFDFIGTELDKDYFEAQEKRFKAHISQQELFEKSELQGLIYED